MHSVRTRPQKDLSLNANNLSQQSSQSKDKVICLEKTPNAKTNPYLLQCGTSGSLNQSTPSTVISKQLTFASSPLSNEIGPNSTESPAFTGPVSSRFTSPDGSLQVLLSSNNLGIAQSLLDSPSTGTSTSGLYEDTIDIKVTVLRGNNNDSSVRMEQLATQEKEIANLKYDLAKTTKEKQEFQDELNGLKNENKKKEEAIQNLMVELERRKTMLDEIKQKQIALHDAYKSKMKALEQQAERTQAISTPRNLDDETLRLKEKMLDYERENNALKNQVKTLIDEVSMKANQVFDRTAKELSPFVTIPKFNGVVLTNNAAQLRKEIQTRDTVLDDLRKKGTDAMEKVKKASFELRDEIDSILKRSNMTMSQTPRPSTTSNGQSTAGKSFGAELSQLQAFEGPISHRESKVLDKGSYYYMTPQDNVTRRPSYVHAHTLNQLDNSFTKDNGLKGRYSIDRFNLSMTNNGASPRADNTKNLASKSYNKLDNQNVLSAMNHQFFTPDLGQDLSKSLDTSGMQLIQELQRKPYFDLNSHRSNGSEALNTERSSVNRKSEAVQTITSYYCLCDKHGHITCPECEKELRGLEKLKEELEKKLASSETDGQSLHSQVKALEEKHRQALAELEKQNQRCKQLETELTQSERARFKEVKELQAKNDELRRYIDATNAASDPDKILHLQAQIEALRGQLEELKHFFLPSAFSMANLASRPQLDDPSMMGAENDTSLDMMLNGKNGKYHTVCDLESLNHKQGEQDHAEGKTGDGNISFDELMKNDQENQDQGQVNSCPVLDDEITTTSKRLRQKAYVRAPRPDEKPKDIVEVHDKRIDEIQLRLQALVDKLRAEGFKECGLILGIDCTASNIFTGKKSFGNRHLHDLSSKKLNFYELVFGVMGSIVKYFIPDNRFPVYIFGDDKTRDKKVRPLYQNKDGYSECFGMEHAIAEYRRQIPRIALSGPTSFKPLIETAIDIAEDKKQFQLLVIIGDGAVSDFDETISAIAEASNYPLQILMIGVGDGDYKQYPLDPWCAMKKLEKEVASRRFANFTFLQYKRGMKIDEFAEKAFSRLPTAYKFCTENNFL